MLADDGERFVGTRRGIEVADVKPEAFAPVLDGTRAKYRKSDELMDERDAQHHREAGRAQRDDVTLAIAIAPAFAGQSVCHASTPHMRSGRALRESKLPYRQASL